MVATFACAQNGNQAADRAPSQAPSRDLLSSFTSFRAVRVRPRRRRNVREVSRTNGAPVRPAPRPRSLRSRRGAAVSQPGGDPAAPIGFRHASTAARTNAAGRRVAAAETAGLGSAPSSPRRGRTAPRSAKPRARPEESGRRARGPMTRGPRRFASLLRRCAPLGRLHGRRRHRFTAEPVPRCRRRPFRRKARSWNTRAQTLRLALCVALLRRCTANASRRSPASRDRLLRGLAPRARTKTSS